MTKKMPEKFEDWTPPWGDDPDDADLDQVARLIYNLQVSEEKAKEVKSELRAARKEVDDLTEANEVFKAASEAADKDHDDATKKAVAEAVASVEKERDQAREALEKEQRSNWRLEALRKFPQLDDDDEDVVEKRFKRISGDDLESFLEDAEDFASELAPAVESVEEDEQVEDGISHLRRQPKPRTPGDPDRNRGGEVSVDKFLEQRRHDLPW